MSATYNTTEVTIPNSDKNSIALATTEETTTTKTATTTTQGTTNKGETTTTAVAEVMYENCTEAVAKNFYENEEGWFFIDPDNQGQMNIKCFNETKTGSFTGNYEHPNPFDDWHYVNITKMSDGNFEWKNKADKRGHYIRMIGMKYGMTKVIHILVITIHIHRLLLKVYIMVLSYSIKNQI